MVASGDSNKARGRNELIADFIQRYTGEPRTRKQVSSHIQVLKPMVKEDQVGTLPHGRTIEVAQINPCRSD